VLYVKHHIQKLAVFFLAMKGFANELKSADHDVLNLTLDDTDQFKNLDNLIILLAERFHSNKFPALTGVWKT
jgi:deoxyribodipyrimidine photolyase-related protein